jgi:hypothetical protein
MGQTAAPTLGLTEIAREIRSAPPKRGTPSSSGLAGPNQCGYRRRDLIRGVLDELLSLQHLMAIVAYRIRSRNMLVTNAFLDAIIPILENYKGRDRVEQMIEAIKDSRKLPDDQRTAIHQAMKKPNVSLALRQYSLPLITTQTSDLTICSLDFQRAVLHVRFHLDLCNQLVPYTQTLHEKTFSDLSPENREAVIANLEQSYRQYGDRAELIVEAIKALDNQYG